MKLAIAAARGPRPPLPPFLPASPLIALSPLPQSCSMLSSRRSSSVRPPDRAGPAAVCIGLLLQPPALLSPSHSLEAGFLNELCILSIRGRPRREENASISSPRSSLRQMIKESCSSRGSGIVAAGRPAAPLAAVTAAAWIRRRRRRRFHALSHFAASVAPAAAASDAAVLCVKLEELYRLVIKIWSYCQVAMFFFHLPKLCPCYAANLW